MKNKQIMQSANFKRDYITTLAVGLFILMFISEILVALGIPLAINYTSIYADHGTRQKMVASFDALRMLCIMPGPVSNSYINIEKDFIRTDLDMLSSHLREYNRTMPMSDVEDVIRNIQGYNSIVAELNSTQAQPFCRIQTLNLDKKISRIEKYLESYKAPGK